VIKSRSEKEDQGIKQNVERDLSAKIKEVKVNFDPENLVA